MTRPEPGLQTHTRRDARGRLIKDENLGLMNDSDGQREPLANVLSAMLTL
jgi:hypothetical protein